MKSELEKLRFLLLNDYEHFQAVMDASPFLLCLTEKADTTYINTNWLLFTGIKLQHTKTLNSARLEMIHPDDISHYLQSISSASTDQLPYQLE